MGLTDELFINSREGYFGERNAKINLERHESINIVLFLKWYDQPINGSQKSRFLLIDIALQWRHNGHDSVSNHQPHHCLLNRLFRRRSKKTSKLRVTGRCAGESPRTGEFPAQMASNMENISIRWRHHAASLGLLMLWWWRRNWLCNASDDVEIDLAIATRARDEWYLAH